MGPDSSSTTTRSLRSRHTPKRIATIRIPFSGPSSRELPGHMPGPARRCDCRERLCAFHPGQPPLRPRQLGPSPLHADRGSARPRDRCSTEGGCMRPFTTAWHSIAAARIQRRTGGEAGRFTTSLRTRVTSVHRKRPNSLNSAVALSGRNLSTAGLYPWRVFPGCV